MTRHFRGGGAQARGCPRRRDPRARPARPAASQRGRIGPGRAPPRILRHPRCPTDEQRAELAELKTRMQSARPSWASWRGASSRSSSMSPTRRTSPRPSAPTRVATCRSAPGRASALRLRARPHFELGDRLGIFDFERAAKISGARFAILRGEGPGSSGPDRLDARHRDPRARLHRDPAAYLVRRECMVGTPSCPSSRRRLPHRRRPLLVPPPRCR